MEWRDFFSAIKVVYGPPTNANASLLSADGSTLLTKKDKFIRDGPNNSETSSATLSTPEPPLPSSSIALTSVALPPTPTATELSPNTPINIKLTTDNNSNGDSVA
ncbi:hypothetical protein SprV_0100063200 [Sparganum proliferum]